MSANLLPDNEGLPGCSDTVCFVCGNKEVTEFAAPVPVRRLGPVGGGRILLDKANIKFDQIQPCRAPKSLRWKFLMTIMVFGWWFLRGRSS